MLLFSISHFRFSCCTLSLSLRMELLWKL
jgi:hypothetical protein